jgi:SAM-dependent methyltransferase
MSVYEGQVKESYSAAEYDAVWTRVGPRSGWDFSRMRDTRLAPWSYLDAVREVLTGDDDVLDVGTGGGERLIELSPYFGHALGIDIDPSMIAVALENGSHVAHVDFAVDDASLTSVPTTFDVILNRQAPYDLAAVAGHLRPGGRFITQQVGERNMRNVLSALGHQPGERTISPADVMETQGLQLLSFDEYDVEYVVSDIDSLVFWLRALDLLPDGSGEDGSTPSSEVLDRILEGNVDQRGFVTNEHRYLVRAARTSRAG